jgi:hypothetical protein
MKKLTTKIALFSILGLATLFGGGYTLKTQYKKKKMTAHIVYFWAKPDLSATDRQKFEAGLSSLLKIKSLKMGYVGKPSTTAKRDVVDNSFSYSLFLFFDDVKGHDAYQIDPIHLAFVEGNQQFWTKVIVHDSDTM